MILLFSLVLMKMNMMRMRMKIMMMMMIRMASSGNLRETNGSALLLLSLAYV